MRQARGPAAVALKAAPRCRANRTTGPGSASRLRADDGQATVELVALLPLLLALALGVGQLVAAGVARELAGNAAQAGAMALLQGGDPATAAREALPGWSKSRTSVVVRGTTVRVAIRTPSLIPGMSNLLTARAEASR